MRHALAFACALAYVPAAALAAPPAHAKWELTFEDNFDGDQVNWNVWASQAGPHGAKRLQARWPENNVVKDGVLYQVTRREDPPRGGKAWSTAHIWTRAFRQRYGYFEARMRYGRYLNNAFWIWRPKCKRIPDPPHFEIDVNEGHTPREVAMCFHFYYRLPGESTSTVFSRGKCWTAPVDLDKDFHLYGVEWNEKEIIWYFDGRPIRRLQNPIAHAEADVRFSTVIMPKQLARDGVPLDRMDGVSMAVDWVRVWRKVRDLSTPRLPALEKCELPHVDKRPPAVDAAGERVVVLREDFESAAPGRLPVGWRAGDGAPAVVAAASVQPKPPAACGRRVLRLRPRDYAFVLFDKPLEGRLEVEFDYWSVPRAHGLLFVTLGRFDPNDALARKTSYYTSRIGPYIHWRRAFIYAHTEQDKWRPFAVWPTGRWARVRLLLDASRGVFDAYDGRRFLGGGLFRRGPAAAWGVGLRHRGAKGVVCVDNVTVRAVK